MSDLPVLERCRVLDPVEAGGWIGDAVRPLRANVSGPALIVDPDLGEPVVCQMPYAGDIEALRSAVRAVPMGTTLRAAGTRNSSRTFGMSTRNVVMRREACGVASLSMDAPESHVALVSAAPVLDAMLAEQMPNARARDTEVVDAVLPEWRMAEGSGWTSGNVNLSSALPYHRDRANFATVSAMPVLRRGVRGGYLHIPEYDVVLGCRDGMVVFFNGNALVHGVTPIKITDDDGYRFSIVYYALRGMKDCFTVAMEQARGARNRTARDDRALDTRDELRQRISGRSSGSERIVR